jgi:hypothetical protein
LDNVLVGSYYRVNPAPVNVTVVNGTVLTLLVEAMGRINYGPALQHDPKGISGVCHAIARYRLQ